MDIGFQEVKVLIIIFIYLFNVYIIEYRVKLIKIKLVLLEKYCDALFLNLYLKIFGMWWMIITQG